MKEGKASETAVRVATSIVASRLDMLLRPLFADPDEPYFEWFINEHSEGARRQLQAWKTGEKAPVMGFLREQIAKGAALFTVLRKKFIEDEARAALADGIEQVVILGAGYDPLALRLQKAFPKARFYEVDHPATQEVKRRALVAQEAVSKRLTLIPVDFSTESAEEKLRAAPGFDPAARGCFVCEGTLMYLTPEEVESVFTLVARAGARGTRFLFTWVNSHILATDQAAMNLAKALRATGEPLNSGHDPGEIGAFLKERGFKLRVLGDPASLKAKYLDPLGIGRPLGQIEFAVAAERGAGRR